MRLLYAIHLFTPFFAYILLAPSLAAAMESKGQSSSSLRSHDGSHSNTGSISSISNDDKDLYEYMNGLSDLESGYESFSSMESRKTKASSKTDVQVSTQAAQSSATTSAAINSPSSLLRKEDNYKTGNREHRHYKYDVHNWQLSLSKDQIDDVWIKIGSKWGDIPPNTMRDALIRLGKKIEQRPDLIPLVQRNDQRIIQYLAQETGPKWERLGHRKAKRHFNIHTYLQKLEMNANKDHLRFKINLNSSKKRKSTEANSLHHRNQKQPESDGRKQIH